MPIRFRRTLKIAPGVRLNFSKSGVSTTVGPKGMKFTFGKKGVRRTIGIPGTGVSETEYIKKNDNDDDEEEKEKEEKREEKSERETHAKSANGRRRSRRQEAETAASTGLRNTFVLVGLAVFFFVGAAVLGLIPGDFISNSLQFLTHAAASAGH